MLPISSDPRAWIANAVGAKHPASRVLTENGQRAQDLWGDVSGDKFLVVFAETPNANHEGFWIPLMRGTRSETLPGAPTALARSQGACVFKDDLPDFTGFPEPMVHRWRAYIQERLEEPLFVSLPLVVPVGDQGTETVAVLNVNADPPDGHNWYRAYHQEWLQLASDESRPFMEVAYYACRIIDRASRRGRLQLSPNSWSLLPGVSSQKLTFRDDVDVPTEDENHGSASPPGKRAESEET